MPICGLPIIVRSSNTVVEHLKIPEPAPFRSSRLPRLSRSIILAHPCKPYPLQAFYSFENSIPS